MSESYYEIAVNELGANREEVDYLTNKAPILKMLPMISTTDGLKHMYEVLIAADAAEIVGFDGELVELDAETDIEQVDLTAFGGKMQAGEDVINKFGGAGSYFGKKMIPVLKKTGQDMESSIVYNSFRSFAITNSNYESALGSANTNYSMMAVTFEPGEIGGLYDPQGFGDGKVFDVELFNNGGLYEFTKNGKIMAGRGQRIKTYFGMQLANPRYISALVNIDIVNNLDDLTETLIDNMLYNAYENENTFIFMHPKLLVAMGKFKASKLNMATNDNDFNTKITNWNGTPIITSRNFLEGTEANV